MAGASEQIRRVTEEAVQRAANSAPADFPRVRGIQASGLRVRREVENRIFRFEGISREFSRLDAIMQSMKAENTSLKDENTFLKAEDYNVRLKLSNY